MIASVFGTDKLIMVSSGFYYTWLVIPFMIFIARVVDVSMGTVRVIFVSRGLKYLAPIVGFFEILIWLLAIGQIMKNLSNPICYVAYAGGFAIGNYVGIRVAEKLSLGVVLIRVVTKKDALSLVECLKSENYGVTSVDGHGTSGEVKVVFTIVPRRELKKVVELVKKFNPNAFYSLEEVGFVEKGIFPVRRSWHNFSLLRLLRPFRKGK
ncbi:MAG: DUF2179 domain-containing protein [Planctomycetota bacterium]|jgi:uncharacterized protein YebE (UPF0316 family)